LTCRYGGAITIKNIDNSADFSSRKRPMSRKLLSSYNFAAESHMNKVTDRKKRGG
jgi:hypothetical protein